MNRSKVLARILVLLTSLTICQFGFAQYRASILGTVTDASGAVVANADVTLTDNQTQRHMTTKTGSDGAYSFNQLAPSTYTLQVSAAGFSPKTLNRVDIRAEQANNVNVVLDVGTTSQTVEVTAEAQPPIDTGTGQIAGQVSQEQIANLPSFGRDVYQLVQLAPGVFGDAARAAGGGTFDLPGNQGPGGSGGGNVGGIFQTENRPQVSAAGQRPDQNNITLDGASINSVTWAGAAVVTPTEDSIKELKVNSNNYDSEFGRGSGAQIQAISQNGTNRFHGSAFIKIDRPGLNAFPRYDPNGTPGISKKASCHGAGGNCVDDRNEARFNQMGGSVGGPIWKNKIFFFFAYETVRNASVSNATGWFETPSVEKAAPANSIASKFLGIPGIAPASVTILESAASGHDCASIGLVQGSNCNFIVGQGLDIGSPLKNVALGTKDPSFNAGTKSPGVGGGLDNVADLFFVQTQSPDRQVSQQFNGRLDFQATQKDLFAYSIYHVPTTHSSFNGPNGAFRASNFFNHDQTNYTQTFLWNHIFTATLLNELRADAAGWKWNEFTSNPQTPYGLPQAHITTTSSGSSIGTIEPAPFGPNFGSIFNQNTYAIKDNLTKVINSHNLKFGAEFTKLEYLDDPTWNAQPTYFFNNYWDFLNDAPSSENITVDPRTGIPSDFRKDTRQNLYAFYAKDDWRVKPNFTVNLGLRWEYFGGLYEKKGNLSSLVLGGGSALLSGAKFVLGGHQYTPPKGNFGPQFGFAYSPTWRQNLVIRGGFGIGYAPLEAAILTNVRFDPPFVTNSGTLTGNKIIYGTAPDIFKFGQFPANPNLVTGFDANFLPTAPGVSLNVTGIPRDLPSQATYRYSLQVEQVLGGQWVASLGYQGALGRHLPLQTNLNALLAPQVLAGQATFNPRLNFVDYFFDGGNSSFNALLAELRHRFSRSFEMDAQYRWSHSLDDGSGPFTTSYYVFGSPTLNYGNSDFDVRHYWKLWGLWQPHFFGGHNSWLDKIVGGWSVSGILNAHSGFPWSPIYGGLGCNAVIPNSGQCDLLPATYSGKGGTSQSTDTFKLKNGNFAGFTSGGAGFFTKPSVTNSPGGAWPVAPVGPLPGLPGIARNSFIGPHYFDVDATLTKGFGLPRLPALGENARFEIRANAYNLFNKLNLVSPTTDINSGQFGRASRVLSGRTVELEGRFRF